MRSGLVEGINWKADKGRQRRRRAIGRDNAEADRDAGNISPRDDVPALLRRIRAEFHEMPGLTLTAAQATRLWQLDPLRSEELLNTLVVDGLLRRNDDGAYLVSSDPIRHR